MKYLTLRNSTLLIGYLAPLFTASCGLAIGRGSEISPPEQLYPATSVDIEILSSTVDSDEYLSGLPLRLAFLPLVLIDFPISMVSDTLLIPCDTYRIRRAEQEQTSVMENEEDSNKRTSRSLN